MPERKPRLTYRVYVVELKSTVLRDKRFRECNPQHQAGMPCVYVGMTGLAVEQRLENHRRGHKGSRYVRKFGKHLLTRLFADLNQMSFDDAQQKEVSLAEELRQRGYAVWQA